MPDAPVLVTTPGGNVGREVVRALRAREIPVRLGVRDPARTTADPGDEVVRFDFNDPSTFAGAMAGARALFLLRPLPIVKVKPTLIAAAAAAERAGVAHCVFLSVDGAERQPWLPHRKVEKALMAGDMTWTFLRPNHFMQNMLGPYRAMIAAGHLRLPSGEGRVSFVDCADLGEVAGMAFADPAAHAGQAYHLVGPESIGFNDLARQLTAALGRDVRYEPVSPLSYFRELRGGGAALPYAAVLTGLHVGIRRGVADRIDPTLANLLDRPPRTVAEFIADHAAELGAPAGDPRS